MTSYLRSDLWCAAFVRRHNDLGHICVLERRGDPIAGQIFVVVDHLNGTQSLFTPAPATAEAGAGRVFQQRFETVEPVRVRDRITQEIRFDPDLWVIALEMRSGEVGLDLVGT